MDYYHANPFTLLRALIEVETYYLEQYFYMCTYDYYFFYRYIYDGRERSSITERK
jgi:hypothetical protein